jgi:hypothetical protein
VDFFERAEDEDGLQEIKQLALTEGDTFLLTRLERVDPKWVTEEDWEKAKAIAEKREMFSMAAFAERKLRPPEVKDESTETETATTEDPDDEDKDDEE